MKKTILTSLLLSLIACSEDTQDTDELYIDMSQKTASSVITFSSCPNDPLGWNYTFTGTSMTLTGSDSWQTPACTTGADESITLNNMVTLASDFDIPFNCVAYPICQSADFNKELSGVDGDGRNFTSTYTFNRQTNVLTYTKTVDGKVYKEVITISDDFSIDMSQKTASSVITFSSCPNDPLGWNYTFTGTSMTLTGSDSWQTPACTTGTDESITLNNMTTLASDFDIPFNCAAYPICQSVDFNKGFSGVDGDGRDFTSIYTFNRQANVLTYVKSVEGTRFTEVITIQ